MTGRRQYRANVQRATCAPNPNKLLLFVYYDKAVAALGDTCWLVPASEFCKLLRNQKATRPHYVFASTITRRADMWRSFRRPPESGHGCHSQRTELGRGHSVYEGLAETSVAEREGERPRLLPRSTRPEPKHAGALIR